MIISVGIIRVSKMKVKTQFLREAEVNQRQGSHKGNDGLADGHGNGDVEGVLHVDAQVVLVPGRPVVVEHGGAEGELGRVAEYLGRGLGREDEG
jgi:hypothetical protein